MNIDWSKAPEDATHAGNSPYEKGVITWFKGISDPASRNYFMNEGSMNAWAISSENLSAWDLIVRPKKQEAWDGVGLPPVGVFCEHEPYEMRNEPHKVEIIAHKKTSLDVAVFWDKDQQLVSYSSYHSFRPIKTAEQLAEEEREDAANKMFQRFGGIGGLTKKQCIWVVSEGYRKQ